MPSVSPSPLKRPSIHQRNPSTHSLSSSAKATNKGHRPHVVGGRGHLRNLSHGKNLSKAGKISSATNLAGEAARVHQRKRSGQGSPPLSPRPAVKRNQSHITLPKNNSHVNLRKNHSTTALSRNASHLALKKLGLPPPRPVAKASDSRQEVFDIGGQSSDEEDDEEAEWEDSTTQSPEMTRNNSKTSTPARVATPNREPNFGKLPGPRSILAAPSSSPPAGSLLPKNRSLPDLTKQSRRSLEHSKKITHLDPVLLTHNPRGSRAPPAMSTISARAKGLDLPRTDSIRSFTQVSHEDAVSPQAATMNGSSTEVGVSHFLPLGTPSRTGETIEEGSDTDSPSSFMPNYHPMPSQSPEKSRSQNPGVLPLVRSRTQQRLELQRREIMRSGGTPAATSPRSGIGLSFGSSASLHSRSGSRGRNRALAGAIEVKTMKREYDAVTKQLDVVRKFRNPVLDSLNRLRANHIIPKEAGVLTPAGASAIKSRPPSRRGLGSLNGSQKPGTDGLSTSLDIRKPSPLASRNASRDRQGRSSHNRRESHDDIGISFEVGRSVGSDDDDDSNTNDGDCGVGTGLTREEAMLRRIWETRDVFECPPSRMGTNGGEVEVR